MVRPIRLLVAALALVGVMALIWAILLPPGSIPATEKPRSVDRAAIDALVTKARESWNVPGVAVAIVRDDQVVYLKGLGVRAVGRADPVTPDTIFPIASCTKGFTTTAMAMLVGEGKLGWDDPVRQHVPNFHLADPVADREITLRDLVCHRAGLGSNDFLWYRSPWPREEVVRRVGLVQPKYPFRGGFEYQSTMFTVAGMAVESASGQSWEEFVRGRICAPLGMNDVAFTTAEAEKMPDRAAPHRKDAQGNAVVIPDYPLDRPEPAGSMVASARGLAQWLRFQLGDGTFDGKRLVSAEALAETHRPQNIMPFEKFKSMHPETTEMRYGMAWVLQDYHGRQIISHAGQIDGIRVHLTLVPGERLGIALLNNLDRSQMNLALSNTIVDHVLGLPSRDWNAFIQGQLHQEEEEAQKRHQEWLAKRDPTALPSCPLADYVGSYRNAAYGTVEIALEDGRLLWKWNRFSAPLGHYQNETFVVQNDILGFPQLIFSLNPAGKPESLKVAHPVDVQFRRSDR